MILLALIIGLFVACSGRDQQQPRTEELVFQSGSFRVVGDLKLPEERGPHPVVLFVHGDGPNNRTSGVTYPPIMERMQRAGYATFAWDKPGTGESTGRIDRSRLVEQRAQIVLDAIALIKDHPDIDAEMIGLWGISQAGYVMPRVLSLSDDIAFMIAVSCPGEAGADQGVFLLTSQAVCAGLPAEDAEEVERLINGAGRAQTYGEYVRYKTQQAEYPALAEMTLLGFSVEPRPESDWHADDLTGEYFRNPLEAIEGITIPVLAFFGELDTQADPFQGAEAFRALLERAGNPHSRIELIPGADHNIILSETGCLTERRRRSRQGWTNYAPQYLDTLEEWLRGLRR
ncbi:MAG: alpha/beta fold hydrolase [Gemmatimonadetes bacterium]|nr:alpha/beta fold hydrolase [Gemmatimonadota bacterium]